MNIPAVGIPPLWIIFEQDWEPLVPFGLVADAISPTQVLVRWGPGADMPIAQYLVHNPRCLMDG